MAYSKPPSKNQTALEYVEEKRAYEKDALRLEVLEKKLETMLLEKKKKNIQKYMVSELKKEKEEALLSLLSSFLQKQNVEMTSILIDVIPSLNHFTDYSYYLNSVINTANPALVKKWIQKYNKNYRMDFVVESIKTKEMPQKIKNEILKIILPYLVPEKRFDLALSLKWNDEVISVMPQIKPTIINWNRCLKSGSLQQVQLFLQKQLSDDLILHGLNQCLCREQWSHVELLFNHLKRETIQDNQQSYFDLDITSTLFVTAGCVGYLPLLKEWSGRMKEDKRLESLIASLEYDKVECFSFLLEDNKNNVHIKDCHLIVKAASFKRLELLKILFTYPQCKSHQEMQKAFNEIIIEEQFNTDSINIDILEELWKHLDVSQWNHQEWDDFKKGCGQKQNKAIDWIESKLEQAKLQKTLMKSHQSSITSKLRI